jgi:hypothetical protein
MVHHLRVGVRHSVRDKYLIVIELKLVLETHLKVGASFVRVQRVGLGLVRACIVGDVGAARVLAPAALTLVQVHVGFG